mgnify:CR=1 FL=1
MSKQQKVLHGSCSEVYINGQRDVLATKIEVKVTGDFEDGAFCGEYGTFPIYNGYSIEGTLTDKKQDSALEVAIAEGFESGVMPDIVLITALTQPSTKKVERWSISGVVLTSKLKSPWTGSFRSRLRSIRTWRRSNEPEDLF